MAKALLGYVGTADSNRDYEIARLRRRVGDLEAEVLRLKAENDALHTSITENLPEEMSPADLLAPATH